MLTASPLLAFSMGVTAMLKSAVFRAKVTRRGTCCCGTLQERGCNEKWSISWRHRLDRAPDKACDAVYRGSWMNECTL